MELYRHSHYTPPTRKQRQFLYIFIHRESRSTRDTFHFHVPARVSNPRQILNMHNPVYLRLRIAYVPFW